MSKDTSSAMLPRMREMRFIRADANWPWILVSDRFEDQSMSHVWAAVSPKWAVWDAVCGSTSVVEFRPWCREDYHELPSRLITISPDKLQMTVRHWRYRRNPDWRWSPLKPVDFELKHKRSVRWNKR